MKFFAKLVRIEFHSSVEFEDAQAFNVVTKKKVMLQKGKVCWQFKLEKFLFIENIDI